MKRKTVVTGYVLWGIAFILTALAVTALVSLPYYLGMFVYGWFRASGSIPYQLIYILYGAVLIALIAWPISRRERTILEHFGAMTQVCVLLSSACFVFIHISPKEESFRHVVMILGIVNTVVALIGIFFYAGEAKNEYYEHLISYCSYPKDKEFLIAALTKKQYDNNMRLDALKLLPFPEEKDTLAQIACGDPDANLRIAAIHKLSCPDAKDALLRCLASDPEFLPRKAALDKLSMPIESQALLSMVGFCEKTLQGIHLNKMDPQTEEIANTLITLYQQINSSKAVARRHAGNHTDEWAHSDNTEFSQCVWDDHSDSQEHTDQGHDDYYEVMEQK